MDKQGLKDIKIYTDGGARGNPGEAAVGVVVMEDGKVVKKIKKTIGITTNNTAEYQAFITSLDFLKKYDLNQVKTVRWFLDSKLVVEQLNRRWRIKKPELKQLALDVWLRLEQLDINYEISHIPREKNTLADDLVNQALDSL